MRWSEYELYFVMGEREHLRVRPRFKALDNVLVVDYDEINETDALSLDQIVENMFGRFFRFFPEVVLRRKSEAEVKADMRNRISDMNRVYEAIKHRKEDYIDPFYGIHARHKGRWQARDRAGDPEVPAE